MSLQFYCGWSGETALAMALLVPPPGVGQDGVNIAVLGVPAQHCSGPLTAAHQGWRITGAAFGLDNGNRFSSHPCCGIDDLSDRKPVAITQIEFRTVATVKQVL